MLSACRTRSRGHTKRRGSAPHAGTWRFWLPDRRRDWALDLVETAQAPNPPVVSLTGLEKLEHDAAKRLTHIVWAVFNDFMISPDTEIGAPRLQRTKR